MVQFRFSEMATTNWHNLPQGVTLRKIVPTFCDLYIDLPLYLQVKSRSKQIHIHIIVIFAKWKVEGIRTVGM